VLGYIALVLLEAIGIDVGKNSVVGTLGSLMVPSNLFSSENIGAEFSPAVDIVYVYMWCSSVGNVFLVSAHSSGPIT